MPRQKETYSVGWRWSPSRRVSLGFSFIPFIEALNAFTAKVGNISGFRIWWGDSQNYLRQSYIYY